MGHALQETGYSGTEDSRAMEPIAKRRAIAAAHGDLLAVVEDDHRISIGFPAHFFHILEIHDEGTMDAQESARVQAILQVRHGLAQKMCFGGRAKTHVVPFGADPSNVGDGKEE